MPSADATRMIPDPSRRTPAAIGGRLGPSRTTSSLEKTTLTARPCSWGRRARAARAATDRVLAPNTPPLPAGSAGSPPGRHHDESVRGPRLRPCRVECDVPFAWGRLQRVGQVLAAPPPLDLLRCPSAPAARLSATAHLRCRRAQPPGSPPGPNRRRSHRGRAPRTARFAGGPAVQAGSLGKPGSLGWRSAVSPGDAHRGGAARVVL